MPSYLPISDPPTYYHPLSQCLHDVSTVKGQLVVLECRLRGTPPLQVMWYREDEQIQDSDDFRILRKSKSEMESDGICEVLPSKCAPFKGLIDLFFVFS